MKKIISFLLALLGLNTACGQQPYTDMNVDEFDKLIAQPDVQLLDVRSQMEFDEGHIDGAFLADVKLDGFVEKACGMLDTARTVAVYCRSGRRSASAAKLLAAHGYKVVNLDRVSFCGLTKKKVASGKYRFLTPKEVAMLQMGAFE